MKYFMFSLFACSISLTACAQPNYLPAAEESVRSGQELRLDRCAASFSSGGCVAMAWEKLPTEDEFGVFTFKTYRVNPSDGSLTEEDPAGRISVVLWMPSMGHGSSPVTVEKVGLGTFRATQVFFSMKGAWEIRFQVKVGDEKRDQAIIPISI